MEQRPLRLGDIVDDYCPRERRITNHVIVALMDDRIQQTRCSTCESEHVYKEARVPKRRKKDEAGVLVVPGSPPAVPDQPVVDDVQAPVLARGATADQQVDEPVAVPSEAPDPEPNGTTEEAWFGHRRLIRASLPKTDAEPLPRPIPEFTMHQRQPSGRQHFRPGFGGNGSGYNGFRHGRPGGGQGQGQGQGNGGQDRGQGGRPGRGGRGRHRGGSGGSKPPR